MTNKLVFVFLLPLVFLVGCAWLTPARTVRVQVPNYQTWVTDEGGIRRMIVVVPDESTFEQDVAAIKKMARPLGDEPLLILICANNPGNPLPGSVYCLNFLLPIGQGD